MVPTTKSLGSRNTKNSTEAAIMMLTISKSVDMASLLNIPCSGVIPWAVPGPWELTGLVLSWPMFEIDLRIDVSEMTFCML